MPQLASQPSTPPRSRSRFLPIVLTIVSILLFLASLPSPALYTVTKGQGSWNPGILPFLLGWLGIFDRMVAWYANPLLVFVWVLTFMRKHPHPALIASIAAIVLAATVFVLHTEIPGDDETAVVTRFGIGFWLWFASIATMVAGTALAIKNLGNAGRTA